MVSTKCKDVTAADSACGTDSARKPKQLMLGRFRLISVLGEGSRGKVFRAEDTKLRRHVALKCMKRPSADAAAQDEAFLQEVRAIAALDHHGIVRVLETGVAEGFRYIALELIEGGTLAALIHGCGSLDMPRASQLCAEAAEALACAAEQGIVHGEIKPENLLLTRAGRCKISDFGLASDQDRERKGTVGSPYVAPEVAGGLSATEKSDVYSLAAVYYFLLTGRAPGAAQDQPGAAGPDVRATREELSREVATIIARGMAKNPDDRPLLADLALQLRGQTIPLGDSQVLSISGPATAPEPTTHVPMTSRWEILSLVVGTVAVVVVVIVAWLALRAPAKPKIMPMLSLVSPLSQRMHPAMAGSGDADPMDLATTIAAARRFTPASDQAALVEAAQARREVEVTGTVSAFQYNPEQQIILLIFAENPKFTVGYREKIAPEMAKKFGGERGIGAVGKKVRVRGRPDLIMNMATILVQDPREIEQAE